jgi:hypothetical protein
MTSPTWQSLRQSADQASKTADHKLAIELYTQALAVPDLPWEVLAAMLVARADSYQCLGDTRSMDADLSALVELAGEHQDVAVQAAALAKLSARSRLEGDMDCTPGFENQAVLWMKYRAFAPASTPGRHLILPGKPSWRMWKS